ncbi:unnamed protein product [Mycena citricolor]|uniref:Uncharacterized protein n=1 Tax=Mycena citricolor TaxID=2018698 RepID=A0AAD2K1W3_9AGAR|nr:unnamed protein product [Mycena citricolor]
MQATSLFLALLVFLISSASTGRALLISPPTKAVAGSNATVLCTVETGESIDGLTFYLTNNVTRDALATTVLTTDPIQLLVNIPSGLSGKGWKISAVDAANPDALVGQSAAFSITSPPNPGHLALIISVVLSVIVLVGLVAIGLLVRRRRQQQRAAAPTFNIETGMVSALGHRHIPSTASSRSVESPKQSLEQEKLRWEQQLDAQFARARAGTPDISRGPSREDSPPRVPPVAFAHS